MRLSILLNPYGGGRRGRDILTRVLPVFEAAGAQVFLSETTHAGHANVLAREMSFADLDGIVVIGGDGTLAEVVNGMCSRKEGRQLPIGIIPGGSGNALAHDLDLLDPVQAAEVILARCPRAVDAIRVQMDSTPISAYALNILGWGLVADIGRTAQTLRWLGPRRYTLVTLLEVLRYRTRRAQLILDDEVIDDRFAFVVACNTIHTGKGMKIAPHASLEDGLMDVVLVRHHAKRADLLKLFPKLFEGRHVEDPQCEYHRVKRCAILPEHEDILNRDGDILGTAPVRLEVVPKAFTVFSRGGQDEIRSSES